MPSTGSGSRIPDVRLVFLGMGNPNPDIAEMARAVELRTVSDELGAHRVDRLLQRRSGCRIDAWGSYLLDADVAVSIHLDNLETRFSFRTRILDYLWARRPMILTGGDALSDLVAARGLGVTVRAGRRRRHRRRPARAPAGRRPPPRRTSDRRSSEFQWPVVAEPLLRWLEEPRRAPDAAFELRGPDARSAIASRRCVA